jgi:hypothetical protein
MLIRLFLLLFCLPVYAGSITDPLLKPESQYANPNAPEEKAWQEDADVPLPPLPVEKHLQAIDFDRMGSQRHFVDPDSLSVGKDGVIRFSLVSVGGGGARNLSYQGMNCDNAQVKLYAFGGETDWSRNTRAEWRPVAIRQANSIQRELFQRYFCHPDIPRNVKTFKRLLKQGGLQ